VTELFSHRFRRGGVEPGGQPEEGAGGEAGGQVPEEADVLQGRVLCIRNDLFRVFKDHFRTRNYLLRFLDPEKLIPDLEGFIPDPASTFQFIPDPTLNQDQIKNYTFLSFYVNIIIIR
jgi:hypothetical protein